MQQGILHEANARATLAHAHRRETVRLQGVQDSVCERGLSQHAREVSRRAGEAQVQYMQFRELLESRVKDASENTHGRESDHVRGVRQVREQQELSPDSHAHTLGLEAARLRDVRQGVQRAEVFDCASTNSHRRETVRV